MGTGEALQSQAGTAADHPINTAPLEQLRSAVQASSGPTLNVFSHSILQSIVTGRVHHNDHTGRLKLG